MRFETYRAQLVLDAAVTPRFTTLHHRKEWFSFLFSIGKPPRPRDQRTLREILLVARPPLLAVMQGGEYARFHIRSHLLCALLQSFFFSATLRAYSSWNFIPSFRNGSRTRSRGRPKRRNLPGTKSRLAAMCSSRHLPGRAKRWRHSSRVSISLSGRRWKVPFWMKPKLCMSR